MLFSHVLLFLNILCPVTVKLDFNLEISQTFKELGGRITEIKYFVWGERSICNIDRFLIIDQSKKLTKV